MDISRDENKRLCDRYPFLIPWNRWSGKLITEAKDGGYWPGEPDKVPDYDYEYTELDDMPDGWRVAFGEQMCEELRNELIRNGDLDRWRITQLKEKYGEMRLYDNGYKKGSRVPDIVDKYTEISRRTCIVCGKPATRITLGWISPFCGECCVNCGNGKSMPIDEFYREDHEDG